MSDTLSWSDDEWSRVRQTVHDEAMRARVAASFLPLYGPLPADTQAVPLNQFSVPTPPKGQTPRMMVDDFTTMRLTTLSVNVYLKNAQIADPELTSALMMFRRAADIVARLEDAIIFNGQKGVGEGPRDGNGIGQLPPVYSISAGHRSDGLLGAAKDRTVGSGSTGPDIFHAIVDAIRLLEEGGHYGPFACVMGDDLFTAITKPIPDSMVLPRDSILPFLNGPLTRSSAIPQNTAVLVSLQGAPVEIVVPGDITVRYLQTTADAEHVFRVQQKFALRVKEDQAVAAICL